MEDILDEMQLKVNMKDGQLLKVVKDFRKGIIGNGTVKSKCYMVCAPLQSYLSILGVTTEIVEGKILHLGETWNHFWLRLEDKRILDPTASQFLTPEGYTMPEIYLGEKPNWYRSPFHDSNEAQSAELLYIGQRIQFTEEYANALRNSPYITSIGTIMKFSGDRMVCKVLWDGRPATGALYSVHKRYLRAAVENKLK